MKKLPRFMVFVTQRPDPAVIEKPSIKYFWPIQLTSTESWQTGQKRDKSIHFPLEKKWQCVLVPYLRASRLFCKTTYMFKHYVLFKQRSGWQREYEIWIYTLVDNDVIKIRHTTGRCDCWMRVGGADYLHPSQAHREVVPISHGHNENDNLTVSH